MLLSSSSRSRRLMSIRHSKTAPQFVDSFAAIFRQNFHATQRKEIIPIILGVGLLVVGRYTWKALKRMDEDWEEYQWKLQQYERIHGIVDRQGIKYPHGTVAIDLGTFYLKLAKDRELLPNREGGRYTFGGVVLYSGDDETPLLVGHQAFGKFYETRHAKPEAVALAGQVHSYIPAVVQSALRDMLDRANADLTQVRPVVTVPPLKWDGYEKAFSDILKNPTFVPEPVAAIWGAQVLKELPDVLETPILVIDIGGLETTLSVVQKNVVFSTTTLSIGGDLFVDAIVNHITAERATIQQDPMALQRLYMAAHVAVAELNTKNSTELHVPFISMNFETRQPEHLEVRLARKLIEQLVENTILTTIDSSKMSTHMPTPTNLPFLWMSILTQLLEVTNLTPMQLSHVLLVGGGAKHPLMESTVKECFLTLQGNSDNVVVPQERSDLVVQGAASILPNYQYDAAIGLVRLESEKV